MDDDAVYMMLLASAAGIYMDGVELDEAASHAAARAAASSSSSSSAAQNTVKEEEEELEPRERDWQCAHGRIILAMLRWEVAGTVLLMAPVIHENIININININENNDGKQYHDI